MLRNNKLHKRKIMKFRLIPPFTESCPHPEGTAGIGIHALSPDTWMTIEEIMEVHTNYYKNEEGAPPTWGELLRDLGTFICFHMVEVTEYENECPKWSF